MVAMKLKLDAQVNKRLRDAYNNSRFAAGIDSQFNKPSMTRRHEKMNGNASNCICACLDRIDSLIMHCNDLFEDVDSVFKFCDILNYGQTLIDCIDILSKIFDVEYSDEQDCSCFNEQGKEGKGSDKEYFKYIRSLCSVHPVETSRHAIYQGEEPEWSPWITMINHSNYDIHRLLAKEGEKVKKVDFAIVVYRNDTEFMKYVYVSIKEVFLYLQKNYSRLEDIITAIVQLDNSRVSKYKESEISPPELFDTYDLYLDNLVHELQIRGFGDYTWKKNEWKTILHSRFGDELLDSALDAFKEKLKYRIQELHNAAQGMDYDLADNIDLILYPRLDVPEAFAYSVQKLSYLQPCWEAEKFSAETIVSEHCYSGDLTRLNDLFDEVSNLKISAVDVSIANIQIDNKYCTNGSEWARVQLKWIEEYLDFEIDYKLSDWYLFLLLVIKSELGDY